MIDLFTSDEIRIFQGGEIPEKMLAFKLTQVIKALNQQSGDISEAVEKELQDPTSPSHAAVVQAAEAAAAEMANTKQDKLTVGENVVISEANVISVPEVTTIKDSKQDTLQNSDSITVDGSTLDVNTLSTSDIESVFNNIF